MLPRERLKEVSTPQKLVPNSEWVWGDEIKFEDRRLQEGWLWLYWS
jgi:hypothetical protein